MVDSAASEGRLLPNRNRLCEIQNLWVFSVCALDRPRTVFLIVNRQSSVAVVPFHSPFFNAPTLAYFPEPTSTHRECVAWNGQSVNLSSGSRVQIFGCCSVGDQYRGCGVGSLPADAELRLLTHVLFSTLDVHPDSALRPRLSDWHHDGLWFSDMQIEQCAYAQDGAQLWM